MSAATAPAAAPEAAHPRAARGRWACATWCCSTSSRSLSLRWFATAAAAGPSSISLWVLAGAAVLRAPGARGERPLRPLPRRGRDLRLDQARLRRGARLPLRLVLLGQQHPVLSQPADVHRGGGHLCDRARAAPGWQSNWTLRAARHAGALWLAVGLNIVGLRTGRWLQNLGALGTYLPGRRCSSGSASTRAFTRPPATPMTPASAACPNLGDWSQLNLWASIAFAFAGLELCAVHGRRGEGPAARRCRGRSASRRRSSPSSTSPARRRCSGWCRAGEVNIVSGFLQALAAGAARHRRGAGLARRRSRRRST